MENILYDAAKAGDVAVFIQVLNQKLVDEVSFANSRNILHIATMHGQARIVDEVLKISPQLARVFDSQNSSPLHIAAAKGHVEIVAMLVSVAPGMCLSRDGQGMNPVHVAAMNGHVEVLKELLRLDSFPARERLHRGQTVLHLCVKHHQFETLGFLLKKLWDLVVAKDDDGDTVMDLVKWCRREEIKRYLGQAINQQNHLLTHIFIERQNDFMSKIFTNRNEQMKLADMTMVVVTLIATMAFQAAVSPPGGVWQEDTSSHRAGEAVMASTYPKIYKHFVRANTTAFVSSLITIYLITTLKPTSSILFMFIAMCAGWVSLASIAVSYGSSLLVITPNTETTKSPQPIIVPVVVVSLAITVVPWVYYRLLGPFYRTWKIFFERELELGDVPNQHEEE